MTRGWDPIIPDCENTKDSHGMQMGWGQTSHSVLEYTNGTNSLQRGYEVTEHDGTGTS